MAGVILFLGEDPLAARQVRTACDELGSELVLADALDDALRILDARIPDVVLCDFETFENVRTQWPRMCVVLLADKADSEQAIEAMKRGALEYLLKPFRQESLVKHLGEALRISRDIHVPPVYETRNDDDSPVERIVGQSPAMQEVYKLIGLVAPRDINVLITGESGTGKELVARAVYHHSPRRDRPFLAVNCAAIPETLLESELFGHEKGAFTGADLRRIGKFEQCDGGTLFLDEVGDIPLATQAKLLRVLQDGTFQRLGGNQVVRSDVRIIAATHQQLERLIEGGRFRQDLYYRLKVAHIEVPPLREREVDVVLLAHYFVKRASPQLGARIRNFAPEVLPALLAYPWPGNVRELENVIKASLVIARGSVFRSEFLPEHVRASSRTVPARTGGREARPGPVAPMTSLQRMAEEFASDAGMHGSVYEKATSMVEREIIRACLDQSAGQLTRAAKLLGISRTTLRKKMSQHGIQIDARISIRNRAQ